MVAVGHEDVAGLSDRYAGGSLQAGALAAAGRVESRLADDERRSHSRWRRGLGIRENQDAICARIGNVEIKGAVHKNAYRGSQRLGRDLGGGNRRSKAGLAVNADGGG